MNFAFRLAAFKNLPSTKVRALDILYRVVFCVCMIWIYYLLYGGRSVVSQCLTGNLTVLSSIFSGENDYIFDLYYYYFSVLVGLVRHDAALGSAT